MRLTERIRDKKIDRSYFCRHTIFFKKIFVDNRNLSYLCPNNECDDQMKIRFIDIPVAYNGKYGATFLLVSVDEIKPPPFK